MGLALIALSIGIVRRVDMMLNMQEPKAAADVGFATRPGASDTTSTIDSRTATTITALGVGVAIIGGGNVMIGTLFIATHLLQTRARRSRLGTDIEPLPPASAR